MKASRTVKTPSTSVFFDETNKDTCNVDQKAFRSLMYAAKRTRSDILLQTTYLSSFCGHVQLPTFQNSIKYYYILLQQ